MRNLLVWSLLTQQVEQPASVYGTAVVSRKHNDAAVPLGCLLEAS